MSLRAAELHAFYLEHRVRDQLRFYEDRRNLFDRAARQAMTVGAVLLGVATLAGGLAGTGLGPSWLWPVLAAVLPAAAAAMTAYSAVYAFEQQSKIYADALRAARAAARRTLAEPGTPGLTDEATGQWVQRTESVFHQEHGQWGQVTLTSENTG